MYLIANELRIPSCGGQTFRFRLLITYWYLLPMFCYEFSFFLLIWRFSL
jgi:hypothetical protein